MGRKLSLIFMFIAVSACGMQMLSADTLLARTRTRLEIMQKILPRLLGHKEEPYFRSCIARLTREEQRIREFILLSSLLETAPDKGEAVRKRLLEISRHSYRDYLEINYLFQEHREIYYSFRKQYRLVQESMITDNEMFRKLLSMLTVQPETAPEVQPQQENNF
ncbi:MAG: hypothetical protein PHQ23_01565 [Candidatus Wallbacteria bacterium]|nr:hypothetical protein [Candidatus Wallbacteria bacterium]